MTSLNKSGAVLSDQARELRRIVEQYRSVSPVSHRMKTIAVLSGKGGVGKSNLALNLALAMAERDRRVILLDADLGLANIDMLCGLSVRYNLVNVLDGSKRPDEVLTRLAENVMILPGGSGLRNLADISESQLAELIETLGILEDRADMLMIDTGAGIHKGVLSFAAAADTAVVVTTPEPTSIRDAYGVLKALTLAQADGRKTEMGLVVNMVRDEEEGRDVAHRIQTAVGQFLGISVRYLGSVPWDDSVQRAVRSRRPLNDLLPASPAAVAIVQLADTILGETGHPSEGFSLSSGLKAFFFRLAKGRAVWHQ